MPRGDALPTTRAFQTALPAERRGDAWVARAGDHELRLTNPDKVFWPEDGITKGDLLTYYFNVSLAMLPHVQGRPLTLKRMPDGLQGPYFYEKDIPSYAPPWMPVLDVSAEKGARTIRFATVSDVASLLWLVNLGCIEIHPHHTLGSTQEHPTYAVFDLDPFPPADFEQVRYVASLVKTALDRLGLAAFGKTSGMTGLQVYVPLDGTSDYALVRAFASAVAGFVLRADPGAVTLEWEVKRRAGKVYIDANMNRAGASFSAPFSVRAKWGAPVAMPFAWDELDSVDPRSFKLDTALAHVATAAGVFAPVAGGGQSLAPAVRELGLTAHEGSKD